MMHPTNVLRLLATAMTAFACQLAWADASAFEDRCRRMAENASIRVVFEDKAIKYDRSHTVAELKNISGKWSSPYHQVMGITHARPSTRLEVEPREALDGNGEICVAPDITVHLGFEEFTVSIAKDIGSECRERIVEAHETDHANTWRDYYRAGGRLMQTKLKTMFKAPIRYASAAEMREKLPPMLRQTVVDLAASIHESASEAQRQIDSPISYQREADRLRGCP